VPLLGVSLPASVTRQYPILGGELACLCTSVLCVPVFYDESWGEIASRAVKLQTAL